MALVNQQAVANGKPAIGFINPAVYALASGPNYTNLFHDITTGNNTWSGSPNLFMPFRVMTFAPAWARPTGRT